MYLISSRILCNAIQLRRTENALVMPATTVPQDDGVSTLSINETNGYDSPKRTMPLKIDIGSPMNEKEFEIKTKLLGASPRKGASPAPYQAMPVTFEDILQQREEGDSTITKHLTPALPVLEPEEGEDNEARVLKVIQDYKEKLESRTNTHMGYPYNLDFDYGPLECLQKFMINNLGDPFIESNYGVHSR